MRSTEADMYAALQAGGEVGSMLVDLIRRNRPAWFDQAACRGMVPDDFYPARGETAKMIAAKAVCAGCAVRAPCLAYALERGEIAGVWGGLSTKQRRPHQQKRQRPHVVQREPAAVRRAPAARASSAEVRALVQMVRSLSSTGMGCRQLARAMRVDHVTVWKWVNGHSTLSPATVARIAEVPWARDRLAEFKSVA